MCDAKRMKKNQVKLVRAECIQKDVDSKIFAPILHIPTHKIAVTKEVSMFNNTNDSKVFESTSKWSRSLSSNQDEIKIEIKIGTNNKIEIQSC